MTNPALARFDAKRARLWLLVVLGSLSAFAPAATDLYLPAFPDVAASYGVEPGAVQFTLSASLLGMALGQLLYGPLSDRYGRKPPLVIGLVIFMLASLACAVAPTLPALVAFRFLQALGGSAGMVISRAIIRDLYSGAEMARMLSAMMTVFAVAPVLAPSLGAAILAVASWQWLFVVLAAFALYCLIGVLTLPETLTDERRTDHGFAGAMRAYAQIGRNRQFRVAATIATMGSAMLFAYIASSPVVFIDFFGVSTQTYAVLFGVNSLALVVGAQLNMRLLRIYEIHTLLRAFTLMGTAAGAVMLVVSVLGLAMPFLLVPLAVVYVCISGILGNAGAELMKPFPHNAASAAALSGVVQMLIGAAVAAALGVVILAPPVQMSLVIVIAGAIAVLLSRLPVADKTPVHA